MPAPDHAAAHRRRIVIGCAKLALGIGIIAWLIYGLQSGQDFRRLIDEPKHWPQLLLAQVFVLAALSVNYVRWFLLVRALDLKFALADAFRLGSLGLMLSQVSLGSVGGDLFKAIAVAREQRGKRTEAVASVVIDRVVGLYGMLLVASAGYFINASSTQLTPVIRGFANVILTLAVIGTVGVALLMTRWFTGPAVQTAVARLPVVGSTVERLIQAAAAYRNRRSYLFAAICIACITHVFFVLAYWCVARGLPTTAPPLATMFMLTPMTLAAGAIPGTPGGLGIAEAAAGRLFAGAGFRQGDGVLVAMTYRVMTYVMVAVGAVYYLRARRAVSDAMHEAEELADNEASGAVSTP